MPAINEENERKTRRKKVAGIDNFGFNPLEDEFCWEIIFDGGSKKEIVLSRFIVLSVI